MARRFVFGTTATLAGDVNGDGFSDAIIGSPFESNNEPDEGRARAFYGGDQDGPGQCLDLGQTLETFAGGCSDTPVALGGRIPGSAVCLQVTVQNTTGWGGRVLAQFEVAKAAQAWGAGTVYTSSIPVVSGSLVKLRATGLPAGAALRWRARTLFPQSRTAAPQTPLGAGRWSEFGSNGASADFRTSP